MKHIILLEEARLYLFNEKTIVNVEFLYNLIIN